MKKMLMVAALMVGGYAAQAQINGPGKGTDCWKFGVYAGSSINLKTGEITVNCVAPFDPCCVTVEQNTDLFRVNNPLGEGILFKNAIDLGDTVIGEIIWQ